METLSKAHVNKMETLLKLHAHKMESMSKLKVNQMETLSNWRWTKCREFQELELSTNLSTISNLKIELLTIEIIVEGFVDNLPKNLNCRRNYRRFHFKIEFSTLQIIVEEFVDNSISKIELPTIQLIWIVDEFVDKLI